MGAAWTKPQEQTSNSTGLIGSMEYAASSSASVASSVVLCMCGIKWDTVGVMNSFSRVKVLHVGKIRIK
jgi:hypothetical protein